MSRIPSNDPWAGFELVQHSSGATPASAPDPWSEFQDVTSVTPENYAAKFREELATLPAMSRGGELALLDQYRERAGLPRLQKQRTLEEERIEAANRRNRESVITDYAAAPGRVAAQLPANIIGLFDPAYALKLKQNVDAYYGTPQRGGAAAYGTVLGGAATPIASLPAGPAGMAAIYGAAGAGDTRTDIHQRRLEGEDISGLQELISAGGVGTLEGVSGYIGGKLFGMLGDKLKNVPGVRELIRTQGTRGVVNLLKRIAPEMLAEGGEEALTQFAENLVRQQTYAPEQHLSEGVLESGLMGAGLAPLLGGVQAQRTHGGHGHAESTEALHEKPVDTPNQQAAPESVAPQNATNLENMTEEQLAAAFPDLVRADTGLPSREEQTRLGNDWAKHAADAAEGVQPEQAKKPAAPNVLDETVARIEKDHPGQGEVIRSLMGMEKGEFVRVKVPVDSFDVQSIIDEAKDGNAEISPAKVRQYAAMKTDAPEVAAITSPAAKDKLFVTDGRHRILAAALRQQKTGKPVEVSAVVPASWAKSQGLTPVNGTNGTAKGEFNQANPAKTEYAEQKATLPPDEVVKDGAGTGEPPQQPPGPPSEGSPEPGGIPPRKIQHVVGKVKEFLGEQFRTEFGRPDEWVRGKTRARGVTNLARMDADKLGSTFTRKLKEAGLDPESDDTHRKIEAAVRGELPVESLPKVGQEWVAKARKEIDDASLELADSLKAVGMEDRANAIKANVGSYLKNVPKSSVSLLGKLRPSKADPDLRLSKSFDKFKRDAWVLTDGKKVVGKFKSEAEAKAAQDDLVKQKKEALIAKGSDATAEDLLRRAAKDVRLHKPISAEWRAEHEIHDPRYLVARSIVETRHNAEMVKLFDMAANTWGQKAPKGFSDDAAEAWAADNKLVQLPKLGQLHNLAGTYVPKPIADDLMEMTRIPGMAEKVYRSYLKAWKASKTIFSPATHGRNVAGNALVFSYLGRVSPFNPANAPHYKAAVASLKHKDADYRTLVKEGVLGTDYFAEEIGRLESRLRKIGSGSLPDALLNVQNKAKAGVNTLGEIYAMEDYLFKLAAYKKYRAEGMSEERAVAEVNDWFPNYARVSKITKWLRNTPLAGSPFVAFTDQALKISGRALARRPLRLASIPLAVYALNELGRWAINLGDDEEKVLNQSRGFWEPVLPFRGRDGRALTWDLRYTIPLVNDLIPHTQGSSLQVPTVLSGPLVDTVVEQLSGTERFTGRQFRRDNMSTGDQIKASVGKAAETLTPLPSWATWGQRRVREAAKPDGQEYVSQAILSQLTGVNIRTPYIAERVVRKVAQNMLQERDRDEARALVKLWNQTYKPADMKDMEMSGLVQGMRSSMKRSKSEAKAKAAEALMGGDTDGAQQIIREFNEGKPARLTELTLQEAQRQADAFRRQGKTR